jgi:hypothetical protein
MRLTVPPLRQLPRLQSSTRTALSAEIIDEHDTGVVLVELGVEQSVKHHIGLMFAADGGISSIFTVDETDTVASDGKTYKGMVDFKLWPPSYNAVDVGTPIAEVKGSTPATRIAVD